MKNLYLAKFFYFTLCFGLLSTASFGVTYTTGASGAWNNPNTWLVGGLPTLSFPTAGDDVIITGGFTISVPTQAQCRNLLIDINSTNTITIGPLPFFSLTVNGTMTGWDNSLGFPNVPSTNTSSINPAGAGGSLIFTGTDINGLSGFGIGSEIIAYWNNINSINVNVTINNTSGSSVFFDWLYTPAFAPTFIDFLKNLTISSGTLEDGSNAFTGIRLSGASAILDIQSGATLNIDNPITIDGTNSINQVFISGTLSSSSYVNSNLFILGSTGSLNTGFIGVQQTEGWWSTTNRPSSFTVDDASTINYSASSSQNVFPRQYGNLTLSNSGTKTLYYNASSGNSPLEVNGDFVISSGSVIFDCDGNPNTISLKGNLNNSGTWTPNKIILFNGSGSQSITGSGSTSFDRGITFGDGVNTNTVTISQELITQDLLIQPNSTFNTGNNNVSISGNWSNNGTFTAGTSTVTFNGTSSISGSANTVFSDCSISGVVSVNSSNITFNDLLVSSPGVINANNTLSVGDLVNSGTVNCNDATINVSGSFTNNNTFNRGTSTVVFNGTGTQNVSGSGSISFHDLTISNSTPSTDVVNLNSNVDLYNILTLSGNGHIDADGSSDAGGLTLVSGDNGTAKIGTIGSGAVFDGNITTQRRIVPGTSGWRFVSTPVKNQTLTDWSDDFSVQGVIGGPLPSSNPIVFWYDETQGTDPNNGVDGWQAFTNITDPISNTGVRVYFFESQLTPTLVLDNTGPPVIGDGGDNRVLGVEKYTIDVDFTSSGFDGGGWNLVENPYACEIDYENVISSAGKDGGLVNVDNGIYIWNPSTGQSGNYGSYVGGVSTNSVTQHIASGQSFFVKANSTGASVSYIEDDKVTNQGNTFIREGIIANVMKVIIESDDKINNDETAIRFRAGSNADFESEFDAYKLANGWINISSLPTEDLDLSINSLGEISTVESIKLRVAAYKFGAFNLTFDGLESFDGGFGFVLLDKYLNTSTNIDEETKYSFEIIESITETYGNERFEILISPEEYAIFGDIMTFNNVMVEDVTVTAEGVDESFSGISDNLGNYSFIANVPADYRLSADRIGDADFRNSVTVYDIIRTRRHLLKRDPFNNPYQYLAADVNASERITIFDLIEMRLVILGWKKEFSGGNNWLFIPETVDLSNDPFDYETSVDVTLSDSDLEMGFTAVKVGDVDNSWAPPSDGRRSAGSLVLGLDHLSLEDDVIEIPVVVQDIQDISGYQFTVRWDSKLLEYAGVVNKTVEGHFNDQLIGEGILTTMWDDEQGQSVELKNGAALFILRFNVKDKNANTTIELNSSVTEAVAFDNQLNQLSIASASTNVNMESLRNGSLELLQNVPNPFDFSTTIEFKIPKAGLARLSVVNMLGEVVYLHEQEYRPGIYSITWNQNQSSRSVSSGVYLYRLESNGVEVVKKMVIE